MTTIARRLVANPEPMLLNESSEGLAPLVVANLVEMIKKMRNQGLSVWMSEQDSRFASELSIYKEPKVFQNRGRRATLFFSNGSPEPSVMGDPCQAAEGRVLRLSRNRALSVHS